MRWPKWRNAIQTTTTQRQPAGDGAEEPRLGEPDTEEPS